MGTLSDRRSSVPHESPGRTVASDWTDWAGSAGRLAVARTIRRRDNSSRRGSAQANTLSALGVEGCQLRSGMKQQSITRHVQQIYNTSTADDGAAATSETNADSKHAINRALSHPHLSRRNPAAAAEGDEVTRAARSSTPARPPLSTVERDSRADKKTLQQLLD